MLKQTLTLVGLTLSLSANAAIVDLGNITRDTSTGFDWLDVTLTRGLSINHVEGVLLSEGGAYSDYRYATTSELTQLVFNYGIFSAEGEVCNFSEPKCTDFAVSSKAKLTEFVLDLGDTQQAASPGSPEGFIVVAESTNGFVGTKTPDGDRMGLAVVSGEVIRISDGNTTYSSNLQHGLTMSEAALAYEMHQWGHFLVKDSISEVPVPAAAWLFGSALLGLGVVKRKKSTA